MLRFGVADEKYPSCVPPRTFGGNGPGTALSAAQAVRLNVEFYNSTKPTARCSAWTIIVPNNAMMFDILLRRDGWL